MQDHQNKLKLGIFGTNLKGGLTGTLIPERHTLNWANVAEVARKADAAGFELQVPVARWRAISGASEFQGTNYETLTWAAGLSAITERSNIFATVHVPVIHPIVAAKQMTTIDHIGNGRFGLNLVCGWFQTEFEMFGSALMGHSDRYAYAAEWLELVRRLWTSEEEFDFEGKYFKIAKGFHKPKPIRTTLPPVMNAGASSTGLNFMAKYCDIGFQSVSVNDSVETMRHNFQILKRLAREEYGRSVEVWSSGWVICRPTENEAKDYMSYCVDECGDYGILAGAPEALLPKKDLDPETLMQKQRELLGGWGSLQLVGTPVQIVDKLATFSAAGGDGIVLVFPNYSDGLDIWTQDVMPLLKQAGLRAA